MSLLDSTSPLDLLFLALSPLPTSVETRKYLYTHPEICGATYTHSEGFQRDQRPCFCLEILPCGLAAGDTLGLLG